MFKVKTIHGDILTVADVKIKGFEYGYYLGETIQKPSEAWFLVCINGKFTWIMSGECELVEDDCK